VRLIDNELLTAPVAAGRATDTATGSP
jgi:hypothetical protein